MRIRPVFTDPVTICDASALLSIIFVAHINIYLTATHLPGVINVTADHLSRQAFQVTTTLLFKPTLIPPSAFQLTSPRTLDWISPHFLQLIQQTIYSRGQKKLT